MKKFIFMVLICYSASLDGNCPSEENKYSAEVNKRVPTRKEMFKKGHMKPFGAHGTPIDVETLKYMISPEDFYTHFVVKHIPVVIKNVTQKWPAYHLWTDEYLEQKYGETVMHMEKKDDDKFNIPQDKNVKDFIRNYQENDLYMVDEVIPEMRKEVKLPLCLQCEEMDNNFFVSYYWHSSGGTMSTVHIDTDENLLCVIRGHKKVIIVSPLHSHDLYADQAKQMGVLDLNSSAVDLEKYPNVMNIDYYEAVVEEGDCIYIPQLWWHQVYSRSERQQAVALWWKSEPYWKKVGERYDTASSVVPDDKKLTYSFASSLVDYELWVQNASTTSPSIVCREQDVRMSEYVWETDKKAYRDSETAEKNAYFEQEVHDQMGSKREKKKKKQYPIDKRPCSFDLENRKSPCHIKNDDGMSYIRYVMDYCQTFDDRGCAIAKPQILNKMMNEEFKEMAFEIPSTFQP